MKVALITAVTDDLDRFYQPRTNANLKVAPQSGEDLAVNSDGDDYQVTEITVVAKLRVGGGQPPRGYQQRSLFS